MKTNAKLRRDAAQRAQPRIVTDAISKTIYLHLATSTVAASGSQISGSTEFLHTVSLLCQSSVKMCHFEEIFDMLKMV